METKDERFEQSASNFHQQQAEGHKLYKDLKNFLSAVKGEYQGAQGDPDGVYAATKKSGG